MSELVKGKHFFLETDMKGPVLKFDTTGKGILTVSIRIFLRDMVFYGFSRNEISYPVIYLYHWKRGLPKMISIKLLLCCYELTLVR